MPNKIITINNHSNTVNWERSTSSNNLLKLFEDDTSNTKLGRAFQMSHIRLLKKIFICIDTELYHQSLTRPWKPTTQRDYDYSAQPSIGFTLRHILGVFTRSAITPPQVNRFKRNLEHCEYIVEYCIVDIPHNAVITGDRDVTSSTRSDQI